MNVYRSSTTIQMDAKYKAVKADSLHDEGHNCSQVPEWRRRRHFQARAAGGIGQHRDLVTAAAAFTGSPGCLPS
jgi:hypothetical protein